MATQAETVFADTIAFTNEKGETKQVKSLTSFGETLSEVEPGVANPILSLHSSDSFVNQNAVADGPRLNMHDATGNGVGDVIESARKMNRMVLETALKHLHPAEFLRDAGTSVDGSGADGSGRYFDSARSAGRL